MNSHDTTNAAVGPVRCPSCGHQHPPRSRQIGRLYHCERCGLGFRITNHHGQTVPVTSGIQPAAPRPSNARDDTQAKIDSPQRPLSAVTQGKISCPFCSAQYPFVPALINRPVRCKSCKGAFQADSEGRVRPLRAAADSGSDDQLQPATGAKIKTGALQRKKDEATAPLRRKTSQISLSTQQTETMRNLSKRMNNLALEALKASTANDENNNLAPLTSQIDVASVTITKSGMRRAATQRTDRQQKHQTTHIHRKSGGALHTIDQEEQARQHRQKRYLSISLSLVAIVVIGWLLWPTSAASQALHDFDSLNQTTFSSSSGSRLDVRRSMTWAGGEIQPISGLASHRLGNLQEYSLTPIQTFFNSLLPIPETDLLIDSTALPEALVVWQQAEEAIEAFHQAQEALDNDPLNDSTEEPSQPPSPLRALRSAASEQGWQIYSHAEIVDRLHQMPQAGPILATLYRSPDSPLRNWAQHNMIPDSLSQQFFTGHNGIWSMSYGNPSSVAYEGSLLRFNGGGSEGEWRLFSLKVVPQ